MDNRTKSLIATGAAIIFCGCPGLFLCIFGALTATGSMPFNTELNGVTNSGNLPPTSGYVLLCLSLLLIAIPIVVGFITLRKKPGEGITGDPTVPPTS